MRSKKQKRRALFLEQLHSRQMLDAAGLTVNDDAFTVRQGSPTVQMDLLVNDLITDEYAGEGKITSSSFGSRGGLIRVAGDGLSVAYELPADFAGVETFEYYIDFEHRGTVTVNIESPLSADDFSVNPDGGLYVLDVLANDPIWSDYDGAGRITAVSHSRFGAEIQVSNDGTRVQYTPPEFTVGKDSFVYFVDDIFPAIVEVTIVSPTAEDRVLDLVLETGNQRLDVLANDPFFEGYAGARKVTQILDDPGLAAGGDPWFEIVDDGAAIEISTDGRTDATTSTHTLRYVVDNQYESQLTVQVNSPVRRDYLGSIANNRVDVSLDVLANDLINYRDERYSTLDPRGTVTLDLADSITAVGAPSLGGQVVITPDGQSLLYTPAPQAVGYETFEYTVDGAYTTTAGFYVSDPPSGGGGGGDPGGSGNTGPNHVNTFCRPFSDSLVLNQNDGPTTIDVLANDFDEGRYACDPYTGDQIISAVTDPRGGTVEISADGKSLEYTPGEDYFGSDSFSYSVDDTFTTTVSVDVVRRVRDDQFRVAPDSSSNVLNVTGNDLFGADYVGPGLVTEAMATTQGGAVTINDDRTGVVYTPMEGFVGEDQFQYIVDGQLKANVSVFVSPTKDELLGRQDPDVFWDALMAEAIDNYSSLFGQETYDPEFAYFYAEARTLSNDSAVPVNFSETNVQVAGVDEADLIETDGENIYVLRENELVIASAWPADELSVLSRLPIEGTPLGMYWQGDRLAVVSEVRPEIVPLDPWRFGFAADSFVDDYPGIYPVGTGTTIVTVIDVSDAQTPSVVHETHMDGDYVESRRIGDSVFLVMRNDRVEMPAPERICEASADEHAQADLGSGEIIVEPPREPQSCRYETAEEYIARMTPQLGELLPNFESFDAEGNLIRSGMIVAPEDFYEPLGESNRSLITVASVNMSINEAGISGSTAVLTSGSDDLYGSADALYVMDRAYTSEDGNVTKILKFDWNGDTGEIEFTSQGQVAGYTLNQFSMDEFDGHFRIATTISNTRNGNASGNSENAIWVLQDNAGQMQIVGDLQNVGLTEEIKSVRFMGERGFVTTFREVDPLYVLDLSDHSDPTRVGYVTLPGYNSYMQPIDANHLLTIGHDGITESIGSTQVVLFDVSEVTRPRIVGRHSFYLDSSSVAEQDHHAFGWFAHHGVLAIPLIQYDKERVDSDDDGYREEWLQSRSDRLALLEIDVTATAETRDGVRLRGEIDNDSAVLRSAYIEDVVYSIANDGIIAADIDDPTIILGTVDIRPDEAAAPESQENEQQTSQAKQMLATAFEAVRDGASQISPPVMVAMEFDHDTGDASYVFDSGERQVLVTVDASETAAVVSEDFVFASKPGNVHRNPENPLDVDDNGSVTSLDALRVLNDIYRNGVRELPDADQVMRQITRSADSVESYLDANGDGFVTPLDALLTINYLHRQRISDALDAQGESPDFVADETFAQVPSFAVGAAANIFTDDDEDSDVTIDEYFASLR